MNPRSGKVLLTALLLALVAGGVAAQQSDKQKKVYRWVDKDGQVHYGDSVPAEYAERDRDVLNKQGIKVGREEGTISNEVQGFLFSKPLPAYELTRLLTDRISSPLHLSEHPFSRAT